MRTKKLVTTAAGISLAAMSLSPCVAMAADGAALFLSKTCFACHGIDAKKPLMPIYPKLAGQNKDYVLAQMKDIKSGARDNGQTGTMRGIMFLVNDTEMEAIAGWLASLPKDNVGNADAEGAKLYHDKVCSTCHDADAKTPVLSIYPRLSGQKKEYILVQMRDIRSGARNNGQSAVMKAFMDRFNVSDAEMETIAEWLSSSK